MAITAAGLGLAASIGGQVASIGSNIFGSNKSAKEARKARKSAERLGAETLKFAREVFGNFQPVIKDTTDFFASTSLEDITSGKVLAPGVRGAVTSFNIGAREVERQTKADLAQRGISDSPAGASELSDFRLKRARGVTDIAQSGVENEINRRLGLTGLGTQTAGLQINAANRITDQLLNRSTTLSQQAGNQAAQAGASLADLLSSFNKRKNPTSLA